MFFRILVILIISFLTTPGSAQIPTPEEFHDVKVSDTAKRFYEEVWSPFCPGLSLHDCTSSQAASLRRDIAIRFDKGESADQILSELKTMYGGTVSMIPQHKGFSQSAYTLPFILLALALLFFMRKIVFPRYRRLKPSGTGPIASSLTDTDKRSVDRWLGN